MRILHAETGVDISEDVSFISPDKWIIQQYNTDTFPGDDNDMFYYFSRIGSVVYVWVVDVASNELNRYIGEIGAQMRLIPTWCVVSDMLPGGREVNSIHSISSVFSALDNRGLYKFLGTDGVGTEYHTHLGAYRIRLPKRILETEHNILILRAEGVLV